jgi:hypothetical protein
MAFVSARSVCRPRRKSSGMDREPEDRRARARPPLREQGTRRARHEERAAPAQYPGGRIGDHSASRVSAFR